MYPVLKRTFTISQTMVESIFHSCRLAGHAFYENVDRPLSAVRKYTMACERRIVSKQQCNFKK